MGIATGDVIKGMVRRHRLRRTGVVILSVLLSLCWVRYTVGAEAGMRSKRIVFEGLRVYTADYLVVNLRLGALGAGALHFDEVSRRINRFYQKNGYLLVSCFLVEENVDELRVYVDEGRLGKVIFHDLNSIDTLRMRYAFNLPHKIYNAEKLRDAIESLKLRYGYKDITAIIRDAEGYEQPAFQLNREIRVPAIGGARLPFLSKFNPRYDLDIYFVRRPGERRPGVGYGFDIHYSKGFMPYVSYVYPSLAGEGDLFEAGASMGLYYGFNLKFASPPKWTFFETHASYDFCPFLRDYFTPRLSSSVYNSRSSRPDIGMERYNYVLLNGSADPGITLLKKLRIHAGFGFEKAWIFEGEESPVAQYRAKIEKSTEYWNIVETGIVLDLLPGVGVDLFKRRFDFRYNYYFLNGEFHEISLEGKTDFEFRSLDRYRVGVRFSKLWPRPPFYHEVSVDGPDFRGLMGKNYHSVRILQAGNEYSTSIYRDLVYAGVYFDLTWFEGSGYDLSGEQGAIVAGIACHVIFLDQFEFNIYYGKDYLFSRRESQMNLYFNLQKKW
jgi:hypothetical protein